jgi:glycosyltransferase involved in cell wall biosynthesis
MPRIAYLSYSSGEYDGRTQRMAETALAAGYEVIVYARWQRGLPLEEQRPGYRVVRIPVIPELVWPWRRAGGRRRLAEIMAGRGEGPAGEASAVSSDAEGAGDTAASIVATTATTASEPTAGTAAPPTRSLPRKAAGRVARIGKGVLRRTRRALTAIPRRVRNVPLWKAAMLFPVHPLGWAIPLEAYAEPADIWHGMWAGSLPALVRLRRKHGGRTIYDSRDVYMRARGFQRLGALVAPFAYLERRWAHKVDAVLTVSDQYADMLVPQLDIKRPPIVRNTRKRYTLSSPPPDLIRQKLGLGPDVRVVQYQGGLMTDRGIEQGIEAIGLVPNAVFTIIGFGPDQARFEALVKASPHRDRIHMLEPVPPDDLLDWTASADVILSLFQPTSPNHAMTTPQKMWEAIAAGTPLVASDLPGMASVVTEVGAGVLVDPTDPADVARGIREIVDAPPDQRRALRERVYRAGQEKYNWENETEALLALYRDLLAKPQRRGRSAAKPSISAT